jgi:hypothetical protein
MRTRRIRSGTVVVGVTALVACAVVLAGTALAQGALQVAPGTVKALGLAPPQPKGPCGQEYHNLPRTLNTHASWTPATGALAYDVQIDCMDCRQPGKWDSEVGAPFQINGIKGTSIPASFKFWGDNKGRWRVRGEFGATAPGAASRPQPARPGPWSAWCEFSFRTSGQTGGLAAATPRGPCGTEFHNLPRELHMAWAPVPGANGYQVEVDCLHCKVVGKWDSETPGGAAMLNVNTTSATFTFPGDNQGRWRVRATQTATGPNTSAIQAGPWSRWCAFSFKTAGTGGEQPGAKPGQPCGINLVSLSKTSGYPDDTFEMNGTWGATQGTKLPCINKGTLNKLQVLTWTPTKLTVRIPMGLAPGAYKVGVYCEPLQEGVTTYSSGWKDFEILEPRPMPDITSKKGIVIGGAIGGAGGKFVPWGGTVTLTEADAMHGSPNNECAFNLSYDMVNLTATATSPNFLNRIKVEPPAGMKVVSTQSALSLAGNGAQQVNTQAYLPIGRHKLSLWIDDDHNVAELPPNGESNNVFAIMYDLQGQCYQPYNPQ